MKSNEYWEALELELQELKLQRDELSRKIQLVSAKLRTHKGVLKEQKLNTKSLCYQMYGKRQRELSPEQLREYNRIMRRKSREKKKKNIEEKPKTISAVLNQNKKYYIKKLSNDYKMEPKTSWEKIFDNLISEFESYASDESSTGNYGTILESFTNGYYLEINIDNEFDTFISHIDISNFDY